MESKKGIVQFVPNGLTLMRVALTAVFLVMLVMAGRMEEEKPASFLLIAFVLFVIAGLTDIVDGKIASYYDVTSKFGRLVDPLADKRRCAGRFCVSRLRISRVWHISAGRRPRWM